MMVFYKERLVFLSVPKTGTTALQSALGDRADMTVTAPPELKHMPLFRYNRFMRPMFDKVLDAQMETMAVIREPVDWLGSWYRFRRRPGFEGHRNATHDMSFDDFVTAYVREQRPSFANVGSQAKFVEPRKNGVFVNHLFRYDHQDRILDFLQGRLNLRITTERRNVSPKLDLTLSPQTRALLRERCPAEFELYDSAG